MKEKVAYSFGMTIPGAEPYSSVRFDIGFDSQVKEGETFDDALDRVKRLVMDNADSEYDRIKGATEA